MARSGRHGAQWGTAAPNPLRDEHKQEQPSGLVRRVQRRPSLVDEANSRLQAR
jgi:hypothetical protein